MSCSSGLLPFGVQQECRFGQLLTKELIGSALQKPVVLSVRQQYKLVLKISLHRVVGHPKDLQCLSEVQTDSCKIG